MPSNQIPEDVRAELRFKIERMCSASGDMIIDTIAPLIIEWARNDQAENPKCEHGIALSDLCEYASHRANDPTPGAHDELLAVLLRKAKFFERLEGGANETFLLLNQAASTIRAELSARQAAERLFKLSQADRDANRAAALELQQRERALIAGVTELDVALQRYAPNSAPGLQADLRAILSRLLPSTPTEEGKSHDR